ncbi:UDP-N-acetylmuramate--L-alanine ligase [Desulfolucanica intricata]|uniref:UDP-N-acetylmuramate--L-alanine ligase n=1 Tax=Desulfolucanica intricata TaxID=1285191 RepID=UPI00082B6CD0|nr:UDP-N-acetylmuramate--L-alanine ligase [Desulfolucanica intricata]
MQQIPKQIHFIGIGGAGMSGIAHILLELGHKVTGSDLKLSQVTERLEAQGAICYAGHVAENIGDAELIVISSAIPQHNPELVAARNKGVPVIHRGEMLARLMDRQKGIAIAGSHGKTTTTSMVGLTLEKNNLDPAILIGGELNDIGGNAKFGKGQYLVAEADESDGSFLKLRPHVVVVTNIENDHMDYYKSEQKIAEAFEQFIGSIPPDGLAVLCLDDLKLKQMVKYLNCTYKTYSVDNHNADYNIRNIRFDGLKSAGDVYYQNRLLGRLELQVPGKHNLSNALAVVAVGSYIGLSFERIAKVLKTYRGAIRRFQLIGEVNDVRVVDDYAHHPTEIKATLKAARQAKIGRLIAVFQPHRYSRTRDLHKQFGSAFNEADIVIINKIYSAGEKPIEGVSAQLIVDALEENLGRKIIYLPEITQVVDYLVNIVRPGDLVLTMGAGNIWTAGVDLVERLKEN